MRIRMLRRSRCAVSRENKRVWQNQQHQQHQNCSSMTRAILAIMHLHLQCHQSDPNPIHANNSSSSRDPPPPLRPASPHFSAPRLALTNWTNQKHPMVIVVVVVIVAVEGADRHPSLETPGGTARVGNPLSASGLVPKQLLLRHCRRCQKSRNWNTRPCRLQNDYHDTCQARTGQW